VIGAVADDFVGVSVALVALMIWFEFFGFVAKRVRRHSV
jgi:hypothetical protein